MTASTRRLQALRHTINRAVERYGILLSIEDVGTMNRSIRHGFAWIIEEHPKRQSRTFFVAAPCGASLPVVYDDRFECIVTVLPRTAREVIQVKAKSGIV